MFDILIVVVCLYFAYDIFKLTFGTDFSEWGWSQAAGILVGVLLVVMAGLKGWMYYKKYKAKQEEEAQKGDGEADGEEAAPEEPRQLPQVDDEDDDLAYLDELDAEEDAKKQARDASSGDDED